LVTPDATLQRKAIFQTYAFLAAKDPATVKVQEFLTVPKEAHPMERAKTEMVSVEIKSVIKQSPDSQQQATESWQVDWVETVRNRDGT
ncbi:VirB8/TrbF family protein, partial [Aeromonas veronii]|uniref:VirB8/TrbF family protein n=2 Tax=Pseudomonadota TaxID=1224 RepID=UPI003D1FE537